jgi:NAD(P)-dependent dehydrogenase (short-subunit alcohol dehydrogenase family)
VRDDLARRELAGRLADQLLLLRQLEVQGAILSRSMPDLKGKVAIVTGAGRGIGREHALALARAGARVVVNDLGATLAGDGADATPAQQVVAELEALGGEAVADGEDVASFEGAGRLVRRALEAFGRLDILVNNAGILRDRMLVNMEEHEWDAVLHVHLKGHFAPTRQAAAHWRERAKAGEEVRARVINTSSPSGVFGNVGQANYGAAKAGIVGFTLIAAQELARYGVTVNAIAPNARTRMTEAAFGSIPAPEDGFDPADPGNNSPIVVALCADEAQAITGQVFFVYGGVVNMLRGWEAGELFSSSERWDPDALLAALQARLPEGAAPAGMLESMHRAGGRSMREG